MGQHVVVGKGPIGTLLAEHLARAGHEVRVISRSGAPSSGTADLTVEHVAADASDPAALTRAAKGAAVLYNCANPAYDRWATDWPPINAALLDAAEVTGAPLVTAGNLYSYGAGSGVMTEDMPLTSTETKGLVRAQLWTEALRRHEAGRVRVTEVRASDYVGPYALTTAHAGARLVGAILDGKGLHPIGSADAAHSWTYLGDFVRALAVVGQQESAWGRAWFAPTNPPLTFRELASTFADAAGVRLPRITPLPMAAVAAIGLVQPFMRELHRMGYQFTEPFVMDSTASQSQLGFGPTAWDDITAETLAWWRTTRG